jgi:hypothetical protein
MMGNTLKIVTGLGVLAGISYFGKRRMASERLAAKGGGIAGYLKGLGQGFGYSLKSLLRIRSQKLA